MADAAWRAGRRRRMGVLAASAAVAVAAAVLVPLAVASGTAQPGTRASRMAGRPGVKQPPRPERRSAAMSRSGRHQPASTPTPSCLTDISPGTQALDTACTLYLANTSDHTP
jgi:hypothetical protein